MNKSIKLSIDTLKMNAKISYQITIKRSNIYFSQMTSGRPMIGSTITKIRMTHSSRKHNHSLKKIRQLVWHYVLNLSKEGQNGQLRRLCKLILESIKLCWIFQTILRVFTIFLLTKTDQLGQTGYSKLWKTSHQKLLNISSNTPSSTI